MIDFHLLFSSPLVLVLFESEDNSPPFPPALPPWVLPQNTLKCRGPLREDATNFLEETTPIELLLASAKLFLIHCRVNEDDTDNDEDEECVLSFFHDDDDDDDDDDSPENNATGGFLEIPPSCGRGRRAVGDLCVPNDPIIGDRYAHVEEDPIVVVDASLWYRAAPLFFFYETVCRIAEFVCFIFSFFSFLSSSFLWSRSFLGFPSSAATSRAIFLSLGEPQNGCENKINRAILFVCSVFINTFTNTTHFIIRAKRYSTTERERERKRKRERDAREKRTKETRQTRERERERERRARKMIERLEEEFSDPALIRLMEKIASACTEISDAIRVQAIDDSKGGTGSLSGRANSTNIQGEEQMKLDIYSHDVFEKACRESNACIGLISEEVEEYIDLRGVEQGEQQQLAPSSSDQQHKGHELGEEKKYIVAFDPLDGSSNVAYGVSVGSIFSVFEYNKTTAKNDGEGNTRNPIEEVLKPQTGRNVMCAGYCVYGSSTDLVIATRKNTRVVGWTLDPFSKTYVKTRANISIPMRGKIYSINEGYEHKFSEGMKKYIRDCKDSPTMMARYVGSMVADVHRTLLAGGTFHYPLGKLRMLYECFPMALVIEVAGGLSISDTGSNTLDSAVASIHERGAIHLGSKENMDDLKKCLGL